MPKGFPCGIIRGVNIHRPSDRGEFPEERPGVPSDSPTPDTFDAAVGADQRPPKETLPNGTTGSIDRADVLSAGIRRFASGCLRFLIIVAALAVTGVAVAYLWGGVLPVLLALIVCTVLWPPTAYMRRRGLPPTLAAIATLLATVAAIVLIVLLIAPSIRHQLPTLVHQFADGLRSLEEILAEPPFSIDNDQLSAWVHQAASWLKATPPRSRRRCSLGSAPLAPSR